MAMPLILPPYSAPLNDSALGLAVDCVTTNPNVTLTESDAGAVRVVTVNWQAFVANIGGVYYAIPAGSLALNNADILLPTSMYVYVALPGGAPAVVATMTDPDSSAGTTLGYAWVCTVRFKSVSGTATIYYNRRSYTALWRLLHNIGDYSNDEPPVWIEGAGATIDATSGAVDIEDGEYRRLKLDGQIAEITAGTILLEDEATTVANLEQITTYSDGSTITGGKYHKLLLGVIVSPSAQYRLKVMRQAKPTVEYATLEEARIDAERRAAVYFGADYSAVTLPIAYVEMLKGDASDLTTQDLRATGITGSGGGGSPVTDHGALTGLGDDDHPQYLLTDGARTLTGNMAVSAGKTIDGVDIGAHTHSGAAGDGAQVAHASLTGITASDHHDPVTLSAAADGVLSLSTQQIGLDDQTANTVLAGPTSAPAAAPAFRSLVAADIPALTSAKISDFNEAAQDAVGGILTDTNDVNLSYDDAGNTISAAFTTTGQTQVTLANGANANVNIGTALVVNVVGPTGSFSISGFTGGYAGRQLFVHNTTTNNMTASNEDAGSIAANRITTMGGAAVTSGIGLMHFVYCGVSQRWLLVAVRA